jgi:outer membrane protein TolC
MKKLMKPSTFFGLLGLMACSTLGAQQQFSLQDAYTYALKHNANALNAGTEVEIGKQRITENVATGLPQISANANYSYNIESPVFIFPDFINGNPDQFTTIPAAPLNQAVIGVNGSMLLFNGQYFIGIATAKQFLELTRSQKAQTERDVRFQVAQTYFLCLVSEASIRTLDSSLQVLENNVEETKALYTQGFAEDLDVEQLELILANTKDARIQADNARKLAYATLKFQMGFPAQEEISLTESLESLLNQGGFSGLVPGLKDTFEVKQRLEYQIMNQQLAINEYQIKLQKAEALPSLSTSLGYQYNLFNNDRFLVGSGTVGAQGGLVWGLNLQVPIFSSWNRMSKLKQLQLEREKVLRQQAYLEQGLQVEYLNARNQVMDNFQRYQNRERGFELAKKIRRVNGLKYKEGLITSLELSQSEQQLFEAQQSYYQALFDLLNSKAALDKAMGTF